ncbi:MAG: hypothetical protein IJQ01_09480 [Selenomonadaceae bacterium]|nr:hypothetical protein [Selenomonadaceae bacterium]
MPKGDGKTLESLYLELGLDLSKLQADFLAADRTINENLGRLNREKNTIKLRVEADIAALDRVTDASKILEIQERGLNQQLSLSRDKLAILEAAYRQVAANKNSTAMAVQRAEQAFLREKEAVAKLEQQLKSLSAQKISFDTSQLQEKISQLNSRIQHIRIKADIDVSKLQGANAAFDAQKVHIAAVTSELELQRQKLIQLRELMYRSAQNTGGDSVQTLNIKSNVLQQIQEISRLETRLKELQGMNINLQIRADSIRQAEQIISENIARINARIENIRVKTDIDVSKLGAAASEFDKAKAHVQGLNRELDLQNQKLAELKKAYATAISASGRDSVKAINFNTDIQKQIQAIDQLKAKINELNKIEPPKTNSLLSGYLNIKGDVTGKLNSMALAFSNLKGATSSADNAITSVLGVIGEIPHPAARAAATLAGLPLIFKGVENSIIDMTRAAAASGDAVYVMSRGMQMSVADAAKFSTNAKVAGAQVNDLAMAVKNVQRQVARGGEDSRAAEWLKRYGESAYDASGNLKDLNQMTFALSAALKRAQADGKGAEFVLNVFRNVSADAITAIEDWADVNEQASKIVKADLGNPKLAHEVQGNLNALNVQSAQFGTSFTNALLPVANEIVPRMTDRLGKMTSLIKENKDVILDLGRDAAEAWGTVEDTIDKVVDGVGELAELARKNRVVRQTDTKTVVERYIDDKTVQNAKDILEREIAAGGYSDEDVARLRSRNDLYLKEQKRTEQEAKSLWAKRREAFAEANKPIIDKYKYDDSIKTATDLLHKLTDEEKRSITQTDSAFGSLLERAGALNMELQKTRQAAEQAKGEVEKFKSVAENFSTAGFERRNLSENEIEQLRQFRKYEETAAAIRDKLSLNDYDFKKSELQRWLQEQLPRDAEQSLEKYNAVMKEYAARDEQIEQERADKLKELRDNIAAADKSALQNKLDTIEKERQAWLKAGMDEAESIELAQKKIAKAYEETNAKIQEYARNAADIEYSMTHTAFEKQLRDIERWEELQKRKAESTEEAAAIGAEAVAKEAKAFEDEMDKIKGTLQSLEDKIFEQEHSQYENDLRRIQQERLRLYENYQKQGILTPDTQALIERYYQNAVGKLNKRADESRKSGGDYTKAPDGTVQSGGNGIMVIEADQIVDDGLIKSQQQQIGLLVEENQIRARLATKLNEAARLEVEKIQATKELTNAQKNLIQQARGFEVIEGDQFVNQPQSFQQIEGDQLLMPTQELQQFGETLQQTSEQIQQVNPLQDMADVQSAFVNSLKDFPPEYFKTLADGTKSVSEMQLHLTESTMNLIDAQDDLVDLLKNLPSENSAREDNQSDGVLNVSRSTKDLSEAQDLLARTTRQTDARLKDISDIPPQAKVSQPDNGFKFGFDWDVASGVAGLGTLAVQLAQAVGAIAPHPAIKAGAMILGAGIGAGAGWGSWQETQAAINQTDERLKVMPADVDLSPLETSLSGIGDNVQSILQSIQAKQSQETDRLQEFFGTLPNIEEYVKSVLLELQSEEAQSDLSEYLSVMPKIGDDVQSILQSMHSTKEIPDAPALQQLQMPEPSATLVDYLTPLNNIDGKLQSILQATQTQETISFETVVTPLNSINTLVGNILTALSNRQPPQINISPNNSIDLGGAYVFDNALKQELVNDITSKIVDEITTAVRQATSQSSYGFSA